MNQWILSASIAIVSVIVGATLTEFSYHFRLRGQDKRKLKAALSNLLELHFKVRRLDVTQFIDVFLERAKLRHPGWFDQDTESESIKLALKTLIDRFVNSSEKAQARDFGRQYEDSIGCVAEIDPFLSYTLRSRSNIPDLLKKYFDWLDNFMNTSLNEKQFTSNQFISKWKQYFIERIIKQIEDDIRELSKSISFSYRFKSRGFFKDQRSLDTVELQKEVDELLTKLESMFESRLK